MIVEILDKKNIPMLLFREQAYCDLVKLLSSKHAKMYEFMFYGLVEPKTNNNFIIERFNLIPNRNTSCAYCECDEEKYIDWFYKTYNMSERRRVRCHAHSHVYMQTSPSRTDNEEFKSCYEGVNDYYIQLIVNQKHKHTCNIVDHATGLKYNNVQYGIILGDNKYVYWDEELYRWDEESRSIKDILSLVELGKAAITKKYNVDDNLSIEFIGPTHDLRISSKELTIIYDLDSVAGYRSSYRCDVCEEDIDKQFDELVKISDTTSKYKGALKETMVYTSDSENFKPSADEPYYPSYKLYDFDDEYYDGYYDDSEYEYMYDNYYDMYPRYIAPSTRTYQQNKKKKEIEEQQHEPK